MARRRSSQTLSPKAARGAERDQHVHVAGPGPQRLPGAAIEPRAEHELHQRRQQQAAPRPAASTRTPNGISSIGSQQRRGAGQRQRRQHAVAAGRPRRAAAAARPPAARRRSRPGARPPAARQPRPRRPGPDPRPLGRQVDLGRQHARHRQQRPLDPAGAGRAGHAVHGEVRHLLEGRVAGRLQRLGQLRCLEAGRHVGRCPLAGEVHRHVLHPRHGCGGSFHPAHAGGATHAANLDVDPRRRRSTQAAVDRPRDDLVHVVHPRTIGRGDGGSHGGKVKGWAPLDLASLEGGRPIPRPEPGAQTRRTRCNASKSMA